MKLEKNSALIVIDTQNKYNDINIISNKVKKNLKKILNKFNKESIPIFFTQYQSCKTKNNCTRKKGHIISKVKNLNNKKWLSKKKPRWINKVEIYERKRTYKCPSYKCDIIDELKEYSNSKNTFISNNMDSLMNKGLLKEIRKKNIKNLYIVGGWGEHCIVSTALSCINRYNIIPYVIEDAVFSEKKDNKIIFDMMNTIIPGHRTRDIV